MTETPEYRLITAVQNHDYEASLTLLNEAGGACQARDLAKLAKDSQGWWSRRFGTVEPSLSQDGDKETLTLSHDFWGVNPVASLTQKKCERVPTLKPAPKPGY